MSALDYDNLSGPDGSRDNMGGTTQRCYFAAVSKFLSIKTPVASPGTLAAVVEITTAHTFKTGGCFKKMYITQNKGKLDTKSVGDLDGKSFKQEFELFYPGSESEAHGFAAQAKNDNFIFLVEKEDSSVNGFLQVGTEMFPAKVSPDFTTGTNESGVQGYMFKVEALATKQHVYKAAVSVTPAP
jgi:hypothetical protein